MRSRFEERWTRGGQLLGCLNCLNCRLFRTAGRHAAATARASASQRCSVWLELEGPSPSTAVHCSLFPLLPGHIPHFSPAMSCLMAVTLAAPSKSHLLQLFLLCFAHIRSLQISPSETHHPNPASFPTRSPKRTRTGRWSLPWHRQHDGQRVLRPRSLSDLLTVCGSVRRG